ncbi:glycoside hydrolase superfamily [Kalaharituber pfeilii]|nr:glycoside hydrolase superfamily [Kalaharituber pfeilii]
MKVKLGLGRLCLALSHIVTWDENSQFIKGERVMLWSGEVHPWRLPVPGLWLDVFQKIKGLGYNAVSFYVHWGLVEFKPGKFNTDGILSLEPFFEAAKKTEIYMIARPGPSINAAQITNGGPVIKLQVENELIKDYVQDLIDKFRTAGVVVPTSNNGVWHAGYHVPGSGIDLVDIYSHDGYPNGFYCQKPYDWLATGLPGSWHDDHMRISPNTPYAILDFQGGAIDDWDGAGADNCAILTNEMIRIFYRNNISFGIKIFNIYGMSTRLSYTSYDYGSSIKEAREITRQKYNEIKLQVRLLMSSPAYLTSVPASAPKNETWTNNSNLWVTRVADTESKTSFCGVQAQVPTFLGDVSVAQLGNKKLTLNGRDSKIHLTDYKVGKHDLLYSSGELFTWKVFERTPIAVFYGGAGETHETVFKVKPGTQYTILEGERGVNTISNKNGLLIINYETNGQTVVSIGANLIVYLVDRNIAYKFSANSVIAKGPYLVRSAEIVKVATLEMRGDINETTSIEVFAPPSLREIRGNYDDKEWTIADRNPETSINHRKPTTRMSLYAGEYGYHTGAQIWRGHFTATDAESSFNISMRGGVAYPFAVYLDETFIGAHAGETQFQIPETITKGSKHVMTIVQDHMGLNGAWTAGSNEFHAPIGIQDYNFNTRDIDRKATCKLTGNLGGEDYVDQARGHVNEGGFYAERQGWHLPGFDASDGVDHAGVVFLTEFDLDLPKGYDIPLTFDFKNTTTPADFKVLLYVNGYQFGKYGTHNTVGLLLWSLEPKGVKLAGLDLVAKGVYQSGYGEVGAGPQPK